jgi:hypothetical protein
MMRMIRYQGLIHSMKKMNSHQLIIDDNSNGGKINYPKERNGKGKRMIKQIQREGMGFKFVDRSPRCCKRVDY